MEKVPLFMAGQLVRVRKLEDGSLCGCFVRIVSVAREPLMFGLQGDWHYRADDGRGNIYTFHESRFDRRFGRSVKDGDAHGHGQQMGRDSGAHAGRKKRAARVQKQVLRDNRQ